MSLIDADELIVFEYGGIKFVPEEFIKDAPTVDKVSERRGRWIPVTNGRGGNECSLCHSYALSLMSGQECLSNYCPKCGVRMDGGTP